MNSPRKTGGREKGCTSAHEVFPHDNPVFGTAGIGSAAILFCGFDSGAWRGDRPGSFRDDLFSANKQPGSHPAICRAAYGPAGAGAAEAPIRRERNWLSWPESNGARGSAGWKLNSAADDGGSAGAPDAVAARYRSEEHTSE